MMYDAERAQQPAERETPASPQQSAAKRAPVSAQQPAQGQPPAQPAPAVAPAPVREQIGGSDGHDHIKASEPLLTQSERDKLTLRLTQALNTFVDSPRQAVSEADSAFDEIVTHLTETLDERRRMLRASWQGQGAGAETEELRLALRQYREITGKLLTL
ncbi:hypothetical protein [Streptomyces sp. NBC_01465]|uniref:hypothetical protein n=1 Tax=Streptomyces sp. NBC_01465 TaxID=2903878 RepID=UPI002E332968|nr:hypothetical protein [Streptomyces sp. NBC_01465]